MTDHATYLDDPAWFALTGPHAAMALVDGDARRYPADVSPFAALGARDALALDSLALEISLLQMVCERPIPAGAAGELAPVPLTGADVPAMLRLVALTEPGPLLPRSIDLGPYLALWHEGGVVAMGGVRLRPPGYREVSTVCTHPEYRRRGYGRLLVRALARQIQQDGEVPFLHVAADNSRAIALYESLGFARRAAVRIVALERL